MRNKTVQVNGRDVIVQERRIKELERLVADLFPGSEGRLSGVDLGKLAGEVDFDLFRQKIPMLFPQVKPENVDDLYPSEIEALLEAFVDVHFFGLKKLIKPLMGLAQNGSGLTQKP